jgi:cysteinyl-tRNA synthetase
VRNITDIDDKIINRAKELNTDWKELIKKYIDRYYQDLKVLGIEKGNDEPRATENISDMIKYIESLINKGYAYVTPSGVYFSVRKFKDYGKLSGQSIDQMLTGVRKEPDETKEDPLDFALWKLSKSDEPSWDSPWGKGRPGWHIECSTMSMKYLKTQTLDIHAGGRDLIFPHHENEVAQAEALTGKPFAKYWIHHGLLTINGQKMAKSLGNFVTIKDFIEKYQYPDILKLFFLSAHYPHPIDYTEEKIGEARKQKKSFDEFFAKVDSWRLRKGKSKISPSKTDIAKVDDICIKFQKTLDDDFNTPQALACLFELIDLGSGFISLDKQEAFNYVKSKLKIFFGIFGLKIAPKEKVEKEIQEKLRERDRARENKDFKKADDIRKEIKELGYAASDTAGGTTVIFIPEQKNTKS